MIMVKDIAGIFLCITVLLISAVTGTNLNSAEEGRCMTWMIRRVAGVDIPNLPTTTNSEPPRQGKRGPVGMKGEPGIPGPPGTCRCDMDELASLRSKNKELAGHLAQIKSGMEDIINRLQVLEIGAETTTQEITTQEMEISTVPMRCSYSVRQNPVLFTDEVTAVKCPPGCRHSGVIYGTGTYQDDSKICRAAIHDGKIPRTGGITFVKKMGPHRFFFASTANGIVSYRYYFGQESFKFCSSMEC